MKMDAMFSIINRKCTLQLSGIHNAMTERWVFMFIFNFTTVKMNVSNNSKTGMKTYQTLPTHFEAMKIIQTYYERELS